MLEENDPVQIKEWIDLLTSDCNAERIVNRAIVNILREEFRAGHLKWSLLRLPQNAFYPTGREEIYFNEQDWVKLSAEADQWQSGAKFDLHDFSHLACATLKTDLYGSKYFGTFLSLAPELRRLLRDRNLRNIEAQPFSDGLLFSELSLGLFDEAIKTLNTEEEIVAHVARGLCDYLLARKARVQPSSGNWLIPNRPVSVWELAILMQNKLYEHTASEFEKMLFTRGNARGRDELSDLSPLDRLRWVGSSFITYFDRRNFLRHRAHKLALLWTAQELLRTIEPGSPKAELVRGVITKSTFMDHYCGDDSSLFDTVAVAHLEEFQEAKSAHLVRSVRSFETDGIVFDSLTDIGGLTQDRELLEYFKWMSAPEGSMRTTKSGIDGISTILAHYVPYGFRVAQLVVPLRAGISMIDAFRKELGELPLSMVVANRGSKPNSAELIWLGMRPVNSRPVILIDVIVATGGTICKLIESLVQNGIEQNNILVMCCYAAPSGIAGIRRAYPGVSAITAVLGESVDADGYVIPKTNGDIGDKLYGKKW